MFRVAALNRDNPAEPAGVRPQFNGTGRNRQTSVAVSLGCPVEGELPSFAWIVSRVNVLDATRPNVLNLENRFAISGPRIMGVSLRVNPH